MRPRVVATNDLHSHLPQSLGALHVLCLAREAGALVVDSGDFLEGSPWFERFGGAPELWLLDALYDVVCPGNHGFGALRDAQLERCAVLSANLFVEGADTRAFEPWRVFTRGGARVGVVGVLSQGAFAVIPPRERAGLSCKDPRAALAEALDALRAARCDQVIVLAHGGLAHDAALLDDLPGAEDVTIILSGHCHSPHHEQDAAHTRAIKAPEYGGWLELSWSPLTWQIHAPGPPPEALHPTLEPLRAWLDVWEAEADASIGAWSPALAERFIVREVLIEALTRLLAQEHPGALALLNVTCARGVLAAGPVRRADVQRVLPFRTQVVSAAITRGALPGLLDGLPPELRAFLIARGPDDAVRLITTDYLCDQLLGLDAPRQLMGPLDAWLWRLTAA